MKVFIGEKFEKSGIEALTKLGCEIINQPDVKAEDLPAALQAAKPAVLVVRGKKVSGDAIKASDSLRMVIRAGAGYDTIDTKTAESVGVYVTNCPGKNAVAVAELTMGLLLNLDRRIHDQAGELRIGKWSKKEYSKARGLHGSTLGIVGMGTIGKEVASRAKAFGMNIVAWSRSLTPQQAKDLGFTYAASPVEVAKVSDAVTVHVASTADTKKLCGADFFAAMKPNAYFINTSRGSVVDEAALCKAMAEKGVRAGLDVFENEPAADGEFANPIGKEKNVCGTHHIGASTDQAQLAIANEVVRIIAAYKKDGSILNAVNKPATPRK